MRTPPVALEYPYYLRGSMRLQPINLYDYEARAKQVLPPPLWDYIDGGVLDDSTVRRNRTALDELTLRPRFLRDISQRDISTTVLGEPVSLPVLISPAGMHMNVHPEGELATARGAGMSKTLMIVSTVSSYSMEEVSQVAAGPLWFQLYHRSVEFTEMLVRRAEDAGFKAICLTVDIPMRSPQERDNRTSSINYLGPFPLGNFRAMPGLDGAASEAGVLEAWNASSAPPITWRELEWLRSLTSLPLVLKGISTAEDAHLAVEHGIDGIFVSTHAGRVSDATMGAIEMLPEVVDAAKGRAEVYVDSGIRRGSDVVKALALGARAVGIGRPLFWGLAVAGAEGVHGVLELLREEIDRCTAYCGQSNISELEPGLVNIPANWGAGTIRP